MKPGALLRLVPALLLLLIPNPARAWFEESDVGPRGVSFGKAFTAIADDASALNWNPAGLSRLSKREVDLSLSRPYNISELRSAYGAVALPYRWGTIGASWQYMGAVDVASENTFTIGVGRTIHGGRNVSVDVGAALKLFRLSLADFVDPGTLQGSSFGSATATAADLGVMLRLPSHVQVGWSLQNIGSPEFDLVDGGGSTTLSSRSRVGIAYRWHPESIVGLDWQQVPGGGAVVNLGGEVWFYNSLAIRVGANDRNAGGGVSIKGHPWQIDLAFLTNQPLGISYRAGVKVPF